MQCRCRDTKPMLFIDCHVVINFRVSYKMGASRVCFGYKHLREYACQCLYLSMENKWQNNLFNSPYALSIVLYIYIIKKIKIFIFSHE